jgi:hypothetical protein
LSGMCVLVIRCGYDEHVDALYRQRILPIDPAIVLTQQSGERFVLKTESGEIDVLVVVWLLGRNAGCRHFLMVMLINYKRGATF